MVFFCFSQYSSKVRVIIIIIIFVLLSVLSLFVFRIWTRTRIKCNTPRTLLQQVFTSLPPPGSHRYTLKHPLFLCKGSAVIRSIPQQTLSPCRPVLMPVLNLPVCRPKAMLALPAFPSHSMRILLAIYLNNISQPMPTQNSPTRQPPHSIPHPTQPISLPKSAIHHIPLHAHKSQNQGGEFPP